MANVSRLRCTCVEQNILIWKKKRTGVKIIVSTEKTLQNYDTNIHIKTFCNNYIQFLMKQVTQQDVNMHIQL